MDHEQRRQRQPRSPRDNAPGSGGASSGKHKGGGGSRRKPVKVVYISNPMRVKTSAARFRALVQELTGRHADPSKYSPEDAAAAAAADLDCAAAQGLSTREADSGTSSETVVAAANPISAAADDLPDAAPEDEDDGFGSQLLENNYAVFSPPTLLYDYDQHPHSKFPFS